jgi:hypothetical protein
MHRADPWSLFRYVFCRLFCPCTKRRHPHVALRFKSGGFSISFEGDFAMEVQDDAPEFTAGLRATLAITDSKGKAAPVDGVPVWSTDRSDILTVTADADGMGANVDFVQDPNAPLGMTTITVKADADLGSGIEEITGVGTVSVTPGKAAGIAIDFASR